MRNVDEVKRLRKQAQDLQCEIGWRDKEIQLLRKQVQDLQHEIGRRDKKIGDQGKEIQLLRKKLAQANVGNLQTQHLVDAVLTAVVETHGVNAEDPDKAGLVLGKRLVLPFFEAEEMRGKYALHARRDMESNTYVLGIVPRELEEPAAGEPEKGDGEA